MATILNEEDSMRRPLSGALLGILFGLALAVVLQQQGVWPLDRLTVFLIPGAAGLIGILVTSVGREGSTGTMIVALVIAVPMTAWGATGFGEVNESGQLNGGCDVVAASDLDTTVVTDSSRRDPFEIDPAGGLTWAATSPGAITDHQWEIWVEIADVAVPIQDGGDPNEGESTGNFGDEPDVTAYAESRGVDIDELRGAFMVGGFISGNGGSCDGFGFVTLVAEPLETLASKIAAAVALAALIGLLLVALTGRGVSAAAEASVASGEAPISAQEGASTTGAGTAAGLAAAASEDQTDGGEPGNGEGEEEAPHPERDHSTDAASCGA